VEKKDAKNVTYKCACPSPPCGCQRQVSGNDKTCPECYQNCLIVE
jgi:hypothetical protein